MVCPNRHVADYTDIDAAETTELAQFTQTAMGVIRSVSGPHGFNLGMNQGHVAGAGIAGHLHQHIVPRWGGDTNFMPIIGHTKTMPQLLEDTRKLLAGQWASGEVAPADAKRSGKARRRASSTPASAAVSPPPSTTNTATATKAGRPAKAAKPTRARQPPKAPSR